MAAPPTTAVVYSPVIRPSRSGKSRRSRLGSSTFTTAMPEPTSTVPSRIHPKLGPARSKAPRAITARQPRITTSALRERTNSGASNANVPQHSSGTDVSRLTVAAFTPSSA